MSVKAILVRVGETFCSPRSSGPGEERCPNVVRVRQPRWRPFQPVGGLLPVSALFTTIQLFLLAFFRSEHLLVFQDIVSFNIIALGPVNPGAKVRGAG